jgi:signal transduction histidine kinase
MIHILVIDDDAIDRESIRRHLSRSGKEFTLHEAQTGEEAFKLLSNRNFDTIFLDYRLPDMDGISLLQKIYNPETDLAMAPVVMLTGQGNEAVMIDALRWGAQDYLVKGNISADTVLIAITKAREIFDLKIHQRQAEQQLQQIQKMDAVGRLTSGIAHDFNNFLTVILGNTTFIRKKLADQEEKISVDDLKRKVEAIEVAANKGADLVKRLMIFTRQRPPSYQIIDVNQSIQETCALIKESLGKSIELNLDLCDALSDLHVDPVQLENAVINIAINARDAMPQGGKIIIETQNIVLDDTYALSHPDAKPGSYIMIAISDTGTGMSHEVMRHIFDPFFTTKPAGEGTGLGLSMVYGFVRQSEGHIQVYSEKGHGTTFKIYLPSNVTGKKDDDLTTQSEEILTGNETILVIENDDPVANVTITILKQLGYTVLLAQDEKMAQDILESENVDLILMDIFLNNNSSGISFAKEIQRKLPNIKIIYTSGFTRNIVTYYEEINRHNFLSKPYSRDDLARKIRNTLTEKENNDGKKSIHSRH